MTVYEDIRGYIHAHDRNGWFVVATETTPMYQMVDKADTENAKLRDEFRRMDQWHSAELMEALDETAKLRELVSELWVSCPVHDSDCDECQHKGGRTGCELYDRMRELEVEP